jgi:hypothetical protein
MDKPSREKPSTLSKKVESEVGSIRDSCKIISVWCFESVLDGTMRVSVGNNGVTDIKQTRFPNGSAGCIIHWNTPHGPKAALVPDSNVIQYIVEGL